MGGTLARYGQGGGTPARSRWGIPQLGPGRGYPRVPLGQGWGTPHLDLDLGWGTPPPLLVRTTEGVLDTRRAVCLLRSHSRIYELTMWIHCLGVGIDIGVGQCSELLHISIEAVRTQTLSVVPHSTHNHFWGFNIEWSLAGEILVTCLQLSILTTCNGHQTLKLKTF